MFGGGGITLRVVLADLDSDGHILRSVQRLERAEGGWFQWYHITDEERYGSLALPHDHPSFIRFPEGVGESVLEALARHYHGSTSSLELRADLRHERERRDKLEEVLGMLAHRQGENLNATVQLLVSQQGR
jgi:hypothetical protein